MVQIVGYPENNLPGLFSFRLLRQSHGLLPIHNREIPRRLN